MKKKLWWGFLKEDGVIITELYFDQNIDKIKNYPKIKDVCVPFFAKNKEDAIVIINKKLK